jgi:hypothetical protein
VANISNDNSEIGADIHEVANYLWKVISPKIISYFMNICTNF